MFAGIKNDSNCDDQMNARQIAIIKSLSYIIAVLNNDNALEARIVNFYADWPESSFIDAIDAILCGDWRKDIDQTC